MPCQCCKNSNPQKKEPKLLKVVNKQSQHKENTFARPTNLFYDKIVSYQQGINPKHKASGDLLAAGTAAKHLAHCTTTRKRRSYCFKNWSSLLSKKKS